MVGFTPLQPDALGGMISLLGDPKAAAKHLEAIKDEQKRLEDSKKDVNDRLTKLATERAEVNRIKLAADVATESAKVEKAKLVGLIKEQIETNKLLGDKLTAIAAREVELDSDRKNVDAQKHEVAERLKILAADEKSIARQKQDAADLGVVAQKLKDEYDQKIKELRVICNR